MPSRRRVLTLLGAAGALTAGGWAMFGTRRANAYYQGPVSDHFDGVQFFNPSRAGPRGGLDFLRWQLGDRGASWPASFPSPFAADRPPERVGNDEPSLDFENDRPTAARPTAAPEARVNRLPLYQQCLSEAEAVA